MREVTTLSAKEILAIPTDQPELLFTGSANAKMEYRRLSMKWHPDRDASNEKAFTHMKALYELAEKKIEAGLWITPGQLVIKALDGKSYEVKYRKHHKIDLGDMYIGNSVIAYAIDKENEDLYKNGVKIIKGFKFPDLKFEENIKRLLPKIMAEIVTVDKFFLIIEKPPSTILLKDALDHCGGKFDDRTMAWMLSRLYNIGCYLKWAKLAHNDIALDTVFIEPANHAAYLLGGWWFTSPLNQKLIAVPGSLIRHAPSSLMKNKVGDSQFDMELIRLIGRQLLGDPNGTKLQLDKKLPRPLVEWIRSVSTGDSFKDFATWKGQVLDASFGKRTFHEMKVSVEDIYKGV